MKSLDRTAGGRQKAGGLAALYMAAAYLLAMPFFLLVVDYPSVVDPVKKVALLAANQGSMHAMYLVTYVVFGIALAVLALALYQRLKTAAPALMQVATVVGLLWAFVLVASGMVFNSGMAAVVGLYPTDPGRAASMWQAIEPVSQGLGGSGGELLGGLWVLLVSLAVLRGSALPRPVGWLGLAVGVLGLVTVIPPLNDAGIVFGLLQIAWFVWLGVGMVRTAERPDRLPVAEAEPA
jgi:hypothetical protein